jgi:hypothetical protein
VHSFIIFFSSVFVRSERLSWTRANQKEPISSGDNRYGNIDQIFQPSTIFVATG